MSQITLESNQMKALIKQAILALFQGNRETVTDALTEILEDIALERAIAEAEDSELVSREEVFKILESVEWRCTSPKPLLKTYIKSDRPKSSQG